MQDTITYDGYGNVLTETNPSFGDRYKFTAREFDSATGLQYNRARYYDPTIGRWTSQDPLGFDGGDANLYRYVGNHPTISGDSLGLEEKAKKVDPAESAEARRAGSDAQEDTRQAVRREKKELYDRLANPDPLRGGPVAYRDRSRTRSLPEGQSREGLGADRSVRTRITR